MNLFVVTALLGYIGSRWVPNFDAWIIFRHLIFSQDLYPSVAREINPVLWTLTHEALFYILVPVMLLMGVRNKYAILVVSFIIYGVFLACGWLGYFKFSQIFYETFHGYAGRVIAIAFALACISLTKGRDCGSVASRLMSPFVFLGVISYSMYIWHYQIIYVVEYYYPFFNRHIPGWSQYGLVSGVILCSICIGISYLSYRFLEKPSMGRLRIALEEKTGVRPAIA